MTRGRRDDRGSGLSIGMVAVSPTAIGGQAAQAASLIEALRGDGHRVDFIPIDPPQPRAIGRLRRVPGLRTLVNEAIYLPTLAALRRCQVAHIFTGGGTSFLLAAVPALLAARAARVPALLHYHTGEADRHLSRWGPLVHPWLRLAGAIVVPSEHLARVFARHGHWARVIPNLVDTSRFRFRERGPLSPRLLSARNLEGIYRVENTLHAFRIIRRSVPGARLMVAGTGREEASLRELASRIAPDGIDFLGGLTPADMPAVYDASDLFLNSSVVDNQPVSILEAFAAGVPVISTGPGGIPEMVKDDQTGLLVPPGSPQAMAWAALRLLRQPATARRLARAALEIARRHTWERLRAPWAAVFGDLTGIPPRHVAQQARSAS